MPKDKGDGKIKDLRPDQNLTILSEAEEEQLEAIEEAVKDDDAKRGDPSGQQVDRIINGSRDRKALGPAEGFCHAHGKGTARIVIDEKERGFLPCGSS